MNTTKPYVPSASEARELYAYINHLVETRGSRLGFLPLNTYRREALRGKLVDALASLAKSYDASKGAPFVPFAKAMLKKMTPRLTALLYRRQCKCAEGADGYIALDAPLDAKPESCATLHDYLQDLAGGRRTASRRLLHRFYITLSRLPRNDATILDALLDADLNKSKAAHELGISQQLLTYRLKGVYARFRAAWPSTADAE